MDSTMAVDRPRNLSRIGQLARATRTAPAGFSNWPRVLASVARDVVGRGAPTLDVETRRGSKVACPNNAQARAVLWEVFCWDDYCIDDIVTRLDREKEPLVVDIGAHIGCFTIALAERV